MAFAAPTPLQEIATSSQNLEATGLPLGLEAMMASQNAISFTGPSGNGAKNRAPAQVRAQRQYQQAQIESASPARLVVMLYDGAIRFCKQGREAMLEKRLEDQNLALLRAQRIVLELMGALDQNAGGEFAASLFRIYSDALEGLVNANLMDEVSTLDRVTGVLQELRDSWAEAERLTAHTEGNI